MSESKTCTACHLRKPITTFQKLGDPRRPDHRRGKCSACRRGKPAKYGGGAITPPKKFSRPLEGSRYIITSAQNATPVHAEFFAALKVAAEHLGAELVVIPLRYKNPTGVEPGIKRYDEWWGLPPVRDGVDDEGKPRFKDDPKSPLAGLLFNGRKKLGPNLVLVGDVKTQPTASSPLTGFESLTGAESCIIGHPKMQFRSVPVPSGRSAKILSTTGACTGSRNYSDTKAGKVGAFHHFLGAVIVELTGRKFFLRQINADRKDGSFTDLDKHYTPSGVVPAAPALGLVLGDVHARYIDPKVDKATFGPGGMVDVLNPETLVFHDVIDGDTVNPHHLGNPFISEAQRNAKMASVEDEVQHVVDFVNSRSAGRKAVIVESNHHDFLARWVLANDWKRLGGNARFYLETAAAMMASTRMTPSGPAYDDPFNYWVRKLGLGDAIRMLNVDEVFTIAGINCGDHGHRGPNGARGSIKNLSRLGSKGIYGHSHTPGIEEGAYQTGTSTHMRLGYNRGPSSWLQAHCVIYATGKRSLLLIVEGEWRGQPISKTGNKS